MKWKTKALVQNVIASLPNDISYKSYYFFQRTVGGLKNFNPTAKLIAAKKVWQQIIASEYKPIDKVFCEIGTGRIPIVPIGYFLMGAKKTVTIDLNPYMKLELLIESLDFMKNNPSIVRDALGDFFNKDRFELLMQIDISEQTNLETILKSLRIEYIAPGDARNIEVESDFFDFYVSCTVFEHVSQDVLYDIVKESRRVLKPNGLSIHRIDYSDHFSHSDKDISAINFLQYSDKTWDRYAGNRYMYMNRLRHSEFVKLFKDSGYTIEREQADHSDSVAQLLNHFEVDTRFKNMSKEDLAITAAWFTLNPNKESQLN